MKSNKDCKYYKKGYCILHKHPDKKGNIGINYFDNIHPCDFMSIPCFEDD